MHAAPRAVRPATYGVGEGAGLAGGGELEGDVAAGGEAAAEGYELGD